MTEETGKVLLIGAGPGAPDLISVRGHRALEQADVVVFDRLVHPALVACAPEHAERIFVGKAPGRHWVPQELINEILIDRARQGLTVVRLKGGDPFVFGRGGEECLALAAAGVSYEVVPGITSAVAVPGYAGIPVTHREVSPVFTVVTGHSCGESDGVDWAALAATGTLVVLMGLSRLPEISSALIRSGRRPETPAAVVRAGTTGDQEVVEGTLQNIALRARHLRSPATIIIGEVVGLRRRIDWHGIASCTGDRAGSPPPAHPQAPAAFTQSATGF